MWLKDVANTLSPTYRFCNSSLYFVVKEPVVEEVESVVSSPTPAILRFSPTPRPPVVIKQPVD